MSPEAQAFLEAVLGARGERVRASRRRRAQRPPRLPRGPERAYERALVRVLRAINGEIAKAVAPHLRAAERAERKDAELDLGEVALDFGPLRFRILRRVKDQELSTLVDQFGRRIVKHNGREMSRLFAITFEDQAPEVLRQLADFRQRNVELITALTTRAQEDVFRLLVDAGNSGMRAETLKKRLAERFQVSQSRAALIARDQTLKLNSQLTQVRHQEAGVDRYVWSTSQDERVRDMHSELEGRVFRWDDPPVTNEQGDTNHPGEDYQCRCVAIPVIPD